MVNTLRNKCTYKDNKCLTRMVTESVVLTGNYKVEGGTDKADVVIKVLDTGIQGVVVLGDFLDGHSHQELIYDMNMVGTTGHQVAKCVGNRTAVCRTLHQDAHLWFPCGGEAGQRQRPVCWHFVCR